MLVKACRKATHRLPEKTRATRIGLCEISGLSICLQEAERVAERWEGQYPKLATQIRDQFEQTLAVHDLPREHQRKVYTSNMIERVMAEVKRRTRVVGIFPNEASADRLIGAHLLERQETWQCERKRYLAMEHLERASDGEQKRKKLAH